MGKRKEAGAKDSVPREVKKSRVELGLSLKNSDIAATVCGILFYHVVSSCFEDLAEPCQEVEVTQAYPLS